MALTPDGNPRKVLRDPETIDECWITPTQYPNLTKFAANPLLSGYLNAYIIEACALVNEICRKKFNEQQADLVLINENLYMGWYKTISVENIPLVTVDNVWLNVTNTFAPVSLEYLQVDTVTGTIKILPDFTVYTQTTLPWFQLGNAANIWIRYTSGYEIDRTDPDNVVNKVPLPVQRATGMLVDYLFGVDGIIPNVAEFKTQTYSQKSSKTDEDPIYSRAMQLLKPYIHNEIV